MIKIIFFSLVYCVLLFVGNLCHDANGFRPSNFETEESVSGIQNKKAVYPERTKRTLAYLVPIEDESSSEEHHKSKRCWRARPVKKIRLTLDSDETEGEKYPGRLKSVKGSNRAEHLRTSSDESTDENLENFKLTKMKNQLTSDDYNIWALVGKRAGNKPNKYICYCREGPDCSGINCQRSSATTNYRPCSTCRYVRPGFVGKVKSSCQNDAENYYKNHEALQQPRNEPIPLRIQYPDTRSGFIQSQTKNSATSIPKSVPQNHEDRRFSYDNPKVILANSNDNVEPNGRYKVVRIPMYGMPDPNAGFKSATNIHPNGPAIENINGYRSGNYPSIGIPGNFETVDKNYRINTQNYFYPYQRSRGGLVASTIPFADHRIVGFQQQGIPLSGRNSFYETHYLNGFDPNILTVPVYGQPQNLQSSNNQKKPDFSLTKTPEEQKNVLLSSPDNLEESKDVLSGKSAEIKYDNFSFEDKNKGVENFDERVSGNLHHKDNFRNEVKDFEVIDKPEQYKFPVVYPETVGSDATNDQSDELEAGEKLEANDHHLSIDDTGKSMSETQELNNEKPLTSLSDDYEQTISHSLQSSHETFTEMPSYDHRTSNNHGEEIISRDQLENSHIHNSDTTTEYLTNEGLKRIEGSESQKSTDDSYSDIQVVTNGYFTSQAYDGVGEENDADFEEGKPNTHLSDANIEESYEILNKNNVQSVPQNEDIMREHATPISDEHIENKDVETVGSEVDEPFTVSGNQSPGHHGIIGVGADSSSSDEVSSPEMSSSSNEHVGGNLEENNERKYSAISASTELENDRGGSYAAIESTEELFEEEDESEDDQLMNSYGSTSNYEDISGEHSIGEDSPVILSEKNQETSDDGVVRITENNDDVLDHNINSYVKETNNEADNNFHIENTPTKYYSPHDRVLEYMKNHGQNLPGNGNPRTGGPLTYPTEHESHEIELDSNQWSDSGIYKADEKILTQTSTDTSNFNDDDDVNFDLQGTLESDESREFSDRIDETSAQDGKHEIPSNWQGSDVAVFNSEEVEDQNRFTQMEDIESTEYLLEYMKNHGQNLAGNGNPRTGGPLTYQTGHESYETDLISNQRSNSGIYKADKEILTQTSRDKSNFNNDDDVNSDLQGTLESDDSRELLDRIDEISTQNREHQVPSNWRGSDVAVFDSEEVEDQNRFAQMEDIESTEHPLEYMKNHGQNLAGNGNPRTGGPLTYPTGHESYETDLISNQRSNSGIYKADKGILTQTSKDKSNFNDDDDMNSDLQSTLESDESRELLDNIDEISTQNREHQVPSNWRGPHDTILYPEEVEDRTRVAEMGDIENTENGNDSRIRDELLTTKLTPDETSKRLKDYQNNSDDDDESSEVISDSTEEFFDTKEKLGLVPKPTEKLNEDEIAEDSNESPEEITKSADVLGDIEPVENSATPLSDTSEDSEESPNDYYSEQDDDSLPELPRKSITPYTPIGDDSAGVNEDSVQLRNSPEPDTDLSFEKSDATRESTSLDRKSHNNYVKETVSINNEKDILSNSNGVIPSREATLTSNNGEILNGKLLNSLEKESVTSNSENVKLINQNVGIGKPVENTQPNDVEYRNEQRVEFKTENYSNELGENLPKHVVGTASHSKINEKVSDDGATKVEFVGKSESTISCTKPPEVENDIGYLGRLAPRKPNPDIKSFGDLIDSDLFYIGDGVRLPLTIKKLKDGSFALSISDKICEERYEAKCPCCVPRKGKILQEKLGVDNDEGVEIKSSNVHRRAISEDENDAEIDHHGERITRSISMPVDEFAEKYNLILNLNDEHADFEKAELPLIQNVVQDPLIQKLKSIDEASEKDRASIMLSALQELSAKEPTEVYGLIKGMKKKLHDVKSEEKDNGEGEFEFEKGRYGYQRDNPILDRIRIIKQLQKKTTKKCERKYQKDCDDAITQKTELLTMILNWLKDVANSSSN